MYTVYKNLHTERMAFFRDYSNIGGCAEVQSGRLSPCACPVQVTSRFPLSPSFTNSTHL